MTLRIKRIKDAGSVAYRSPINGIDDRPARERLRTHTDQRSASADHEEA
jgi:hypothetical protein